MPKIRYRFRRKIRLHPDTLLLLLQASTTLVMLTSVSIETQRSTCEMRECNRIIWRLTWSWCAACTTAAANFKSKIRLRTQTNTIRWRVVAALRIGRKKGVWGEKISLSCYFFYSSPYFKRTLNLSRTPVLRIAKEVLPNFLQLYLKDSKKYARNKNILCMNSLCANIWIINAECKIGTW